MSHDDEVITRSRTRAPSWAEYLGIFLPPRSDLFEWAGRMNADKSSLSVGVFYLIRHAEPLRISPGRPEVESPLSDRGRRAAEQLPAQFVTVELDEIYSSPYRRARETVEPLARARNLSVIEIQEFRERTLGDGPFADPIFLRAVRATWDDFGFIHPGGESNESAQKRARLALNELLVRHGGRPIAISTHATLLALIVNSFDPSFGFEFWRQITMPDVYRLEVHGNRRPQIRRVGSNS